MKIYCNRREIPENSYSKYVGKDLWIACDISYEKDDLTFASTYIHIKSIDNDRVIFNLISLMVRNLDLAEINRRLEIEYDGKLIEPNCIEDYRVITPYYYTITEPITVLSTAELVEIAESNNGICIYPEDL